MNIDNALRLDRPLYRVNGEAVDCPLEGGLAVLDSKSGAYFYLNISAAIVWNGARTAVSQAHLLGLVKAAFAQSGSDADVEQDVAHIIGEFVAAGLFTIVQEGGSPVPRLHATNP